MELKEFKINIDLQWLKDDMEFIKDELQESCNKMRQVFMLLVKHLFFDIGGTKKGIPMLIYNTLNESVSDMESRGLKPILIIGDDTDSYLTCYLYNLIRIKDGLDPLTLGGVLQYRGKSRGLYLDGSLRLEDVGLVFMDTDITLPNNSISLSNHVNLMNDKRIININNYLGSNSLDEYMSKYPFGTTQILLGVCKVKGIKLPDNLYNYFLRSDMSRIPKRVFMLNTKYHSKVLGIEEEFKGHLKEIKDKGIKSDYKLFKELTVDSGRVQFIGGKESIMFKLKEFNSPHKDVRLSNLIKVYDLLTMDMDVKEDGVLEGNVNTGVFTIYKLRNNYYYTQIKKCC